MFEFITNTIINSNEGILDGGKKYALITVGTAPNDENTLIIDRHHTFKDYSIVDAYTAEYAPEVNSYITLALGTPVQGNKSDIYRIALTLRSSQYDANPMFANDMVYKGKPLYVEFKGGTPITKIKNIFDTYLLGITDIPYLTATVDESNNQLTLTCADGYLDITYAELQKYVPNTDHVGMSAGEFVNTIDLPSGDFDAFIAYQKGFEGIGTYRYMINNVKLPTLTNLRFGAIAQDELPVQGGQYVQFTVNQLTKDRKGIAGEAVGQLVDSATQHVFWISTALASDFKSKLESLKCGTSTLKVGTADAPKAPGVIDVEHKDQLPWRQ